MGAMHLLCFLFLLFVRGEVNLAQAVSSLGLQNTFAFCGEVRVTWAACGFATMSLNPARMLLLLGGLCPEQAERIRRISFIC